MKKILLILIALTITSTMVTAQHRLGVTMGPAITNSNFGFGFSGHYRYTIKDIKVGANLGYYSINGFHVIPITASAEYFFPSKKVSPFVGGDLGFYSYTGGTSVGLAPTVGLQVPVTKMIAFQANFKYHILFASYTTNIIGLNVGLVFKL